MLAERLLHGMQRAGRGETLNRCHLRALGLRREQRARLDRAAVDVDHAGAALAGVAADVGAGEVQVFAQELNEKRARLNVTAHGFPVHG